MNIIKQGKMDEIKRIKDSLDRIETGMLKLNKTQGENVLFKLNLIHDDIIRILLLIRAISK